jgi:hypothetical protein
MPTYQLRVPAIGPWVFKNENQFAGPVHISARDVETIELSKGEGEPFRLLESVVAVFDLPLPVGAALKIGYRMAQVPTISITTTE